MKLATIYKESVSFGRRAAADKFDAAEISSLCRPSISRIRGISVRNRRYIAIHIYMLITRREFSKDEKDVTWTRAANVLTTELFGFVLFRIFAETV